MAEETLRQHRSARRIRLTGEERRRQIIETAATLFSHKGFRGTTTREIAEAVGVSEAMLFKHFATKEELYAAIIEAKSHGMHALDTVLAAAEREDDAGVLRALALEMIERTRRDPTLLRLTFLSALEGHALSDMMFRSRVQELDNFLSRYIARRIAAGAFRDVDPMQAAVNFIGMVTTHILRREFFARKSAGDLTNDLVIEEMTRLFLNGVRTPARFADTAREEGGLQ
jgi:AcrR family transcriptional regulator